MFECLCVFACACVRLDLRMCLCVVFVVYCLILHGLCVFSCCAVCPNVCLRVLFNCVCCVWLLCDVVWFVCFYVRALWC